MRRLLVALAVLGAPSTGNSAPTSTGAIDRAALEREARGAPAVSESDEVEGAYSPAEVEAREAEMFGAEPEESAEVREREAEMFGSEAEDAPAVREREAEMFGEAPAATSTAARARRGRSRRSVLPTDDDRRLGDGVLSRLTDRIDELDDTLAIGGRMWLQLQATALENTNIEDSTLSSPNLVDVFMDARPNNRLRGFLQGRLTYDPTGSTANPGALGATAGGTQVQLDQLWLRFDVARTVFVTAGKQRIRWGSGRLWNPTDFLNQQRLNPISLFDVRLGVPLVKLHLPVESLGWNFYAVANLDEADRLRRVGGAVRAELLLGPTELSLSAALRDGDAQRLGFDFTAPVWDFDLRLELGLIHGDSTPRFVPLQPSALSRGDILGYAPENRSRVDDWIPQLVVGAEIAVNYSDEDSMILGAEYFFNDAGYGDEDVYDRLLLAGRFNPLDVARHYLGFYVTLLAPGDWDRTSVFISGIASLSDLSGVVRVDLSLQMLTFLSWRIFSNVFWGTGAFSPRLSIDPRLAQLCANPVNPVELQDCTELLDRIPVTGLSQAQLQDLFVSGAADGGFTGGLPVVQVGTALVIDL